jgi:hypothetical protein
LDLSAGCVYVPQFFAQRTVTNRSTIHPFFLSTRKEEQDVRAESSRTMFNIERRKAMIRNITSYVALSGVLLSLGGCHTMPSGNTASAQGQLHVVAPFLPSFTMRTVKILAVDDSDQVLTRSPIS